MIFENLAHSAEETESIGFDLAKKLDTDGIVRAFIALRGEMGVGKTAFVRGFAHYFDISGVRSPTYTVVNEYKSTVKIFHFDMYRLEDEDDLWSIGYEDYVKQDGFVLCEWSENIEELLPNDRITVTICRVPENENSRSIKIDFPEELAK